MLYFFNKMVRECGQHFDMTNQVHAATMLSDMLFDLNYLLGDDEPLQNALNGLLEFRKRPSLIASLCQYRTPVADITVDDDESDVVHVAIFVRPLQEDDLQVFVSGYSNGLFVVLPAKKQWKKAGLGWLLTHCPNCEADGDNPTPWMGSACDCSGKR